MSAKISATPWELRTHQDASARYAEEIDAPHTIWTLHGTDGSVICGSGDAYRAGDPLVLRAGPTMLAALRDLLAAHSIADPLERMTSCAAALAGARFAISMATGETTT